MIVSCPSCNVHYRQVPPPVEAVLARCSRCDETFDVDPPKSRYRLVPQHFAPVFESGPDSSPLDLSPTPVAATPPDEARNAAQAEALALPAEDAAAGAATKKSGSRFSPLGVVLGLLLGGAATAAGYYLSVEGMLGTVDTVTATAGGAGVGLLLALATIRSTMRPR